MCQTIARITNTIYNIHMHSDYYINEIYCETMKVLLLLIQTSHVFSWMDRSFPVKKWNCQTCSYLWNDVQILTDKWTVILSNSRYKCHDLSFSADNGWIHLVSNFYVGSGKASALPRVIQTFIYEKAEIVRVFHKCFSYGPNDTRLLFFPAKRSDSLVCSFVASSDAHSRIRR